MSFNGIIDELLAGTWREPATGRTHGIPIEAIVIDASLEGREADLFRARHGRKRPLVVHDENTRAALGARVLAALQADGGADEFVWPDPHCSEDGVAELAEAARHAEVLIGVGSGSITDSCKYLTFKTGREYSVFATSPMTAYTTPTASVTVKGFKTSQSAHSPKGVFFDLGVLSRCPRRLVAATFADVICRTTAQVDWLMSHLLFGTDYTDTAYAILEVDEPGMIAGAPRLPTGEFEALAKLTRIGAILGLGTSFTGTTHMGSMAEHMISHAIDMFADRHNDGGHPGSSHGEQVGVATLAMSRLQNMMLDGPAPVLRPTEIPRDRLAERYGAETGATMIRAGEAKALDAAGADRINAIFAERWDEIRAALKAKCLPYNVVHSAMASAGCPMTATALGLEGDFYRECVRDSRWIRDRHTMMDLADDAGTFAAFAARAY